MTDQDELHRHWRALQRDDDGAVEELYDAAGPKDVPSHVDAAVLAKVHDTLNWWQVRWPVASAAVVVLAVTSMIPLGLDPYDDSKMSRFETAVFSPEWDRALTRQHRAEATRLIEAFLNTALDENEFRKSWRRLTHSGPPIELDEVLMELDLHSDESSRVYRALLSDKGI
jgi:hypothetical protein|tara:strand:+ start:1252 stop:1761 length:510 start_codon:yes stop_codon:yes gene_type:complete